MHTSFGDLKNIKTHSMHSVKVNYQQSFLAHDTENANILAINLPRLKATGLNLSSEISVFRRVNAVSAHTTAPQDKTKTLFGVSV